MAIISAARSVGDAGISTHLASEHLLDGRCEYHMWRRERESMHALLFFPSAAG